MEPKKILYTVSDVMAMLSISRATVYRLVDSGELRFVHIGRASRIRGDCIRTYLNKIDGGAVSRQESQDE